MKPGDTCTQEQADLWFAQDSAAKARMVDLDTFEVPTTQNQFDAMCSLAFNIGTNAFAHSTVCDHHCREEYPQAADAFLMWDKAHTDKGFVEIPGLKRRREAERTLYLTPDAA